MSSAVGVTKSPALGDACLAQCRGQVRTYALPLHTLVVTIR
jgi:hypothetical protein